MKWGKLYSAEAAFVMGGVVFLALAYGSDLFEHLGRVAVDPDHAHVGGSFFIRVNIPAIGIAFIAFGSGMYLLEHRRDRVNLVAFVAGMLILIDGITHLFAINDHIDIPLQVVFFGIVAPLQIAAGILFPFLPRSWDRYWIVLTIALIAVYGASRRFGLPGVWAVEAVEPLGIFSKVVEVLTLFPLYSLVRGPIVPSTSAASVTKGAEP